MCATRPRLYSAWGLDSGALGTLGTALPTEPQPSPTLALESQQCPVASLNSSDGSGALGPGRHQAQWPHYMRQPGVCMVVAQVTRGAALVWR